MKKFLSLVLALVMTMSLVTVSAGAKDFGDSDKIQYKEAVDVMSAVKVIDGYSDGTFNPSNTLTRGAAAKIICNLILGPTTAKALVADAAPYKDVPTDHTFAGYIAYCQKEKIISGYADGTFRPANSLTGYAFMKMLLGALGYDAEVELYTGPNWSINVAKRALSDGVGLNKDLIGNFNGVKAVTREEACLYAFNTLKATMVEYDSKTSVTAGNTTVIVSGSKAKDMENKNQNTDGNIDKDGLMQFAEKYFIDLKGVPTDDEFMRPATLWKIKAEEIGTYTDTADLTYTKSVEIGDIYKDLALGSKVEKKDVSVYVDGVVDANQPARAIVKGDDDNEYGANGVLTEVFYNKDTETVTITEVNTYVGSISKTVKATDKKDAYVVVNAEGPVPKTGYDKDFETDEKFGDDDYVLYTYSLKSGDEGIQSVAAAKKVSGTVTHAQNKVNNNKNDAKSLTIDGTTYKDSKKIGGDNLGDISVNEAYDVYLDAYGYMIYIARIDEIGDYALLVDAQGSRPFEDNKALLVFSDGTSKLVNTKKNYTKEDNLDVVNASGVDQTGTVTFPIIVTYRADESGVYTLRAVSSKQSASSWNVTESATNLNGASGRLFELKSDKAGIKVANNIVTANSVTQFVVRESSNAAILAGDDWDVYTGIKNAPDATAKAGLNKGFNVYYYCKDGNMATVMFVVPQSDADIDNSVNKQIFFSKDVSKLNHDKVGSYYEYPAIVNGELTTVKVEDDAKTPAGTNPWTLGGRLFKSYAMNKDGFITRVSDFTDTYGTPVSNVEKGIINNVKGIDRTSKAYTVKVGTASGENWTITVDENAKIYNVNTKDEITEIGYKGIGKDENALVSAYVEDYMIKTLVIYDQKTTTTPAPTPAPTKNGGIKAVVTSGTPGSVKLVVTDVKDAKGNLYTTSNPMSEDEQLNKLSDALIALGYVKSTIKITPTGIAGEFKVEASKANGVTITNYDFKIAETQYATSAALTVNGKTYAVAANVDGTAKKVQDVATDEPFSFGTLYRVKQANGTWSAWTTIASDTANVSTLDGKEIQIGSEFKLDSTTKAQGVVGTKLTADDLTALTITNENSYVKLGTEHVKANTLTFGKADTNLAAATDINLWKATVDGTADYKTDGTAISFSGSYAKVNGVMTAAADVKYAANKELVVETGYEELTAPTITTGTLMQNTTMVTEYDNAAKLFTDGNKTYVKAGGKVTVKFVVDADGFALSGTAVTLASTTASPYNSVTPTQSGTWAGGMANATQIALTSNTAAFNATNGSYKNGTIAFEFTVVAGSALVPTFTVS